MEEDLVERAAFGDRRAFDELVRPHLPKLRGYLRRMVTTPSDTDDLVQETLMKAHARLGTFRQASSFSTWLIAIGTRAALDFLRARKRYRAYAQEHVRESLHADPQTHTEVFALIESPTARFDAREHVAFCFSCVARSLEPEEQAAVILRDVLEISGQDAATAMSLSESTMRHRLSAGRRKMTDAFDGLCGLVNKQGVCHQCRGLREAFGGGTEVPSFEQSGESADEKYRHRLPLVRSGDLDTGAMQPFHDYVWKALDQLERSASGDTQRHGLR